MSLKKQKSQLESIGIIRYNCNNCDKKIVQKVFVEIFGGIRSMPFGFSKCSCGAQFRTLGLDALDIERLEKEEKE